MARNTSLVLNDHFSAFVDEQVKSGRYASVSEVVREGLRLLEDQERERAWLRDQIAEAEAAFRNGDFYEESDEFWDGVSREVDERLKQRERLTSDVRR